MAKTKVFISYDFDHDDQHKHTLIGQSKRQDSPFSVNDRSIQVATEERQQKARAEIEACDVFVVLLGEHTHQAQGVKREVKMATDIGRRRFQLRKQGQFPTPIEGVGEVFAWKWKNLKKLLA